MNTIITAREKMALTAKMLKRVEEHIGIRR